MAILSAHESDWNEAQTAIVAEYHRWLSTTESLQAVAKERLFSSEHDRLRDKFEHDGYARSSHSAGHQNSGHWNATAAQR